MKNQPDTSSPAATHTGGQRTYKRRAKVKQANQGRFCLAHAWEPPKDVYYHAGPNRNYGQGIVYRLPDGGRGTAAAWLKILDGKRHHVNRRQAEQKLRRRIDQHAATLNLPGAAVVVENEVKENDIACDDLLTALTVISKSADHVYLRDKEPILEKLRPGRSLVVVLPRNWRSI